MKKNICIYVLCCLSLLVHASAFRTERIFVAPCESDYRPGDSITVVGQLLSTDSTKVPYSKYLYVEIFDRNDSVLLRKKLRTDERGGFTARLHASPIWESDVYYLRAYTKLMQNFHPSTFPVVPLQIGKKVVKPEIRPTFVNCQFYPEGGTLVDGKLQRLVFQLTDYHGFPLSIPYSIVSGKDTLAMGETSPSGFQRLQYIPQKGKHVELHSNLDGAVYQFVLPEPTDGATLQVFGNSHRLTYQILTSGLLSDTLHLYFFHQDTGLKELDGRERRGIVDLRGLGEGLLTLFLTDGDLNILSERSCYFRKHDIPSLASLNKTEYSPGETLRLSSPSADSVQTFVRFYPEEYWCGPHADVALNWTSDLVSDVRFPINYHLADNKTGEMELDCWLATSRFIRFDLERVVHGDFTYLHPYEEALTIEGQATDRSGHKIKGGVLNVFNTNTGDANLGELDEEGRFIIPVADFGEDNVFFISCLAGKKGKGGYYEYHFKDEVYPGVSNPYPVQKEKALGDVEVEIGFNPQSNYGLDKNNLLSEIIVKAKTKVEDVPTERFYGSHFVDVEQEDKYHDFASIIADIPVIALEVTKVPQSNGPMKVIYNIYPTRGRSLFEGEQVNESDGAVILVDGMRITATEAMHFLPFELSSVEYLHPKDAVGVTSGAIHGALVIKTRKANIAGAKNVKSQGVQYVPMGLANMNLCTKSEQHVITVPQKAGIYRLLVDMISAKGKVHSEEFRIEVK